MSFVKIARDFLTAVKNETDPYTTAKGVIKVRNYRKVDLMTPSHLQFAKYWRGPGKRPPLDSILQWVGEKGIIFEGTDERGTAFAIQKSIGEKGTKNYVPNAPNALEEALKNHSKEYFSKLSKDILEKQNKAIQAQFDNVFPDKIIIKL